MNRTSVYARFSATLSLAALLVVAPAYGQTPGVDNRRMAVLKTYPANQITNFPTGQSPVALAFDGEHMWVANQADNTVMKFDTSTGEILGTFPTGNAPGALAFDGANVWVANANDSTVMQLRASDGKILGTFPYAAGSQPDLPSLLFDGSHIWVLSRTARRLTKFRATDGSNMGTFDSGGAVAMAFDGTYIWLVLGSILNKVQPSDGSRVQTVSIGASAESITFDGTYLYVGMYEDGSILAVRASDGTVQKNYCAWKGCASSTPMPIMYPGSMAFDGTYIWAAFVNVPSLPGLAPFVTKIRASDGALMATFNGMVEVPMAVAFDGANIWIADYGAYALIKL